MSEVKIGKHYLEIGTTKYFRGKPENVLLGSFGQKKDPVGALAYLAVEGHIRRRFLKGSVRRLTTATVDWSRERSAEVDAHGTLKYFGLDVKAAVNASYEHAKTARLKLVKFAIDEGPLKRILNEDDDEARKALAREGTDGRVVSEVWVLMKGELAEHFATAGTIDVAATADDAGLELSVSGGPHGSQTVTFTRGTTFAFSMHKVKKWNNGKTEILDMEDDRKGMG